MYCSPVGKKAFYPRRESITSSCRPLGLAWVERSENHVQIPRLELLTTSPHESLLCREDTPAPTPAFSTCPAVLRTLCFKQTSVSHSASSFPSPSPMLTSLTLVFASSGPLITSYVWFIRGPCPMDQTRLSQPGFIPRSSAGGLVSNQSRVGEGLWILTRRNDRGILQVRELIGRRPFM